MSKGQKIAK